jgi:lipopolysaccharide assembly protein A
MRALQRWTQPPTASRPVPDRKRRIGEPKGTLMKYLLWLLKAAIFFTLFAFALNNQHDATVYFFFGTSWRAPLVLVVLAAFAGGLMVGALGMLPGWWRHRAAAQSPGTAATTTATSPAPSSASAPLAALPADLPTVRQHGL